MPTIAHIPLLTATLRASQPALRHAAAATLRHLAGAPALASTLTLPTHTEQLLHPTEPKLLSPAMCSPLRSSNMATEPASLCPERDPEALVPVAVEGAVLAALDSETDAGLASLLQVRVAAWSTCAQRLACLYHCKAASTGQSRCLQQACAWLADQTGLL